MSLQLSFIGKLVAGPAAASENDFPSGVSTLPFALVQEPKGFSVDTGVMRALVNSPSAFAALAGVGPGGSVTNAAFLYMRSQVGIDVRITRANPAGGSIVQTMHVAGLLVLELDAAQPVTLVEVQGAGTVEYYACGNT